MVGLSRRDGALALLGLVAIAAVVAAPGLWNGFAGDDVYIIAQNPRVHELSPVWEYFRQSYWSAQLGGGLYRPVATLGFALQWKLGGPEPWFFHAVSLLLFTATTVAVWLLARRLLSEGAAWLVAAFFAVHPLHVEAVANIVGQPEILVTLLHVLAVTWYFAERRRGMPRTGVLIGISGLYAISCFTKENGLVLPGLLLLAELLLVPAGEPLARRLKGLTPLFGVLALIAAGFLVTRGTVLGGLVGEYPHPAIRGVSFGTRALTMLAVVPQWWRLLLVPWHLQADYMPLELDRATTFGAAQALGLLVLGGWSWGAWRARRTYPVCTFGLGWVAVTVFPVSNLVVPTGILLAERTLFSASVGACLAVGGLAPWLAARIAAAAPWERSVSVAFLGVLLLFWGGRAAMRAPVWRNDAVLARHTVLDAPLSYRAHAVMGKILFEEGDPAGGEHEYQTALRLYPHDPNVFAGLAKRYRDAGLDTPAIPLFRKALELAPEMTPARNMLIYSLARSGDSAGAALELAEKVRRGDPDANQIRMLLDSLEQSRRRSRTP